MVTKTIKVTIPDWLYRYRWENIVKYAKWLWKPNRCLVCGVKVNYRHPEIKWKGINGNPLMVSYNVINHYNECICALCVADLVTDKNAVPKYNTDNFSDTEVRPRCDCCGELKTSFKQVAFKMPDGRKVALTTGREWWNGFAFCTNCISKALREGKQGSSMYIRYRDKKGKYHSYPQNNFGLPVVDGKVKFPW